MRPWISLSNSSSMPFLVCKMQIKSQVVKAGMQSKQHSAGHRISPMLNKAQPLPTFNTRSFCLSSAFPFRGFSSLVLRPCTGPFFLHCPYCVCGYLVLSWLPGYWTGPLISGTVPIHCYTLALNTALDNNVTQ